MIYDDGRCKVGIYGALDIEKMGRLIDTSQHFDNFVDSRTRNGDRVGNPSQKHRDDVDQHDKELEKDHDNEPDNLPSLGNGLQLLHKKGVS